MTRAVIIPARITHKIEVGNPTAIEDYEFFVGGNVDPLPIELLDITLWLNADGRRLGLEYNARASFLWWYHDPRWRSQGLLSGDVVVTGSRDADGNIPSLSDELIALFTGRGRFRIEIMWGSSEEWIDYGNRYDDYFDAIVWAMIINQRPTVSQIKVVRTVDGGVSARTNQ